MLATIGPARSIFGELAVDIALATSANRHARDHIEHVGWTWSGAHRAKEHLDLAVRLLDSFVELDVPAAQPSANHDATFHSQQHSSLPQKSPTYAARREHPGQLGSTRVFIA